MTFIHTHTRLTIRSVCVFAASVHPTLRWYIKLKAPTTNNPKAWYVCYFSRTVVVGQHQASRMVCGAARGRWGGVEEGFCSAALRRSGNRRRGREAGSASAVYEFKVGLHTTTTLHLYASRACNNNNNNCSTLGFLYNLKTQLSWFGINRIFCCEAGGYN